MEPSYAQLNVYNQYLQAQVDKFTEFMLKQEKLNEKHTQIEYSVQTVLRKIYKIQQKLMVIEVNQKDTLLQLRKSKAEKQNLRTIEMRIENIESDLSKIFTEDRGIFKEIQERQNPHKDNKLASRQSQKFREQSSQLIQLSQKGILQEFLKKGQAEQMISQAKQDLQFKLRKLQIQTDKNKQSFLKLTHHINSLSNAKQRDSLNKRQSNNQNRAATQSTRDMRSEGNNQENGVTKKQLRKMERKLQTFFSEKISELTNHHKRTQPGEFDLQKSLKFKKMQQRYDKLTVQHQMKNKQDIKEPLSERKIDSKRKGNASQKRISLFENQMLRQKGLSSADKKEMKRNVKQKETIQSPIGWIQFPKTKRSAGPTKNEFKKATKSRQSQQRLKRVNIDYMMQ